jgi:putative spermidine/putrescine transport system substrate-binding protein
MRIRGLLIVLLSISFLAPAAAQETAKPSGRVVVGVTGGLLGVKLRQAVDEYARNFPLKVVYVEGNSSNLLAKVRAQKSNPQIDLFFGNDQTFAQAKALGLLEKINPALVTNISKVPKHYRDPDGYGQYFEVNPVGYCYRTDIFKEHGLNKPTSWLEYRNPKLSGRAIMFPPTQLFGLHHLIGVSMALGGTEANVERAWPAFKQMIANKAVILQTTAQAETMAIRGEAWIYPCSSDRARLASSKGSAIGFSIPSDGKIFFADFMAPVRGAQNPVAAQLILNHMLSASVQTRLSSEGAIIPVNSDVHMTLEQMQRIGFEAGKPLPEAHFLDAKVVASQLPDMVERFNRMTSR